MGWTDDEMEQWVATTIENARVQPSSSRILLSIVRFRATLVALCPVCPDAAIFVESDMGLALSENLQKETKINDVEAYIVRSPCDVHRDCQGGWLSAEESRLFEAHARFFTKAALKVTILARETTSLQLRRITRRQLVSGREQLCIYYVNATSGGERIEAFGDRDFKVDREKIQVSICAPNNVKSCADGQSSQVRNATKIRSLPTYTHTPLRPHLFRSEWHRLYATASREEQDTWRYRTPRWRCASVNQAHSMGKILCPDVSKSREDRQKNGQT